jgi:hypothetical protein
MNRGANLNEKSDFERLLEQYPQYRRVFMGFQPIDARMIERFEGKLVGLGADSMTIARSLAREASAITVIRNETEL